MTDHDEAVKRPVKAATCREPVEAVEHLREAPIEGEQ